MTISVVQSAASHGSPSSSGSVYLPSVTNTNVLVLIISSQYQASVPSGFTLAYQPAPGGGSWGSSYSGTSVYVNGSLAGGNTTVSINFSTSNYWQACLVEVSGIGTTVDVTCVDNQSGSPTGVGMFIPNSGSFAQAAEICFAALTYSVPGGSTNAAITSPPTDGTGTAPWTSLYVDQDTLVDLPAQYSYRVLTSTSYVFPAWSWTDTTTTGAQALGISFKSGSGSGAATVNNVCVVNCGF